MLSMPARYAMLVTQRHAAMPPPLFHFLPPLITLIFFAAGDAPLR